MKTWNIGIVGAGMVTDIHARALQDLPRTRLVGFCDGGSGRAKTMAQKYSCRVYQNYKEMVTSDEIDIIIIATPSGLHLEPTIAAARAGKHVLCEKPLEISLERIDAMIDAHQQAGTLLGGIFQNRFTEAMQPLKEAITTGRLGVITWAAVFVPWWRNDAYYHDSWHGTWKLDGGGALMNQSIHMVDLLCDLMPPVQSVQAYTHKLGHPGIETEDTSVAVVRFSTGALGMMYGSTASYPGQPRRFEITGTKGTIVYQENSFTVWQFAEERPGDQHIRQQFSQSECQAGAADPAAIPYKNHMRNFEAFIDALETGGPLLLDGKEARKAVALVLAIYQAARDQTIVHLGEC